MLFNLFFAGPKEAERKELWCGKGGRGRVVAINGWALISTGHGCPSDTAWCLFGSGCKTGHVKGRVEAITHDILLHASAMAREIQTFAP
jgi:hypothetical protein